jgi:hypothetical protein
MFAKKMKEATLIILVKFNVCTIYYCTNPTKTGFLMSAPISKSLIAHETETEDFGCLQRNRANLKKYILYNEKNI